jgi:aminoglycoside 6'-N-acetyltransferase
MDVPPKPQLTGAAVVLRLVQPTDRAELRRILAEPAVARWWGPPDSDDWPDGGIADDEARYAVLADGAVVGLIQYGEEPDLMYRHASVDIMLDPAVHGRGLGRDAIRTLVRHLIDDRGHHRVVIDPAAANERAIAVYASVGFRPVGVMRRYERDADGRGWHDGLLMELLAGELR